MAPYLPGRLGFASEADIDEFVRTLQRYEDGALSADEWRAFRLVRGVYGQRQPGVQMLRVKIPQGVLTAAQLRALAAVATDFADGRCHLTTRQNAQFYGIPLSGVANNVEGAMRRCAEAGLTTREACGHSVRNVTACPLAGVDAAQVFDVTPYADALTRHLLRGPRSSSLPRKFKIAFEGCHRGCVAAPINDLAFLARRDEAGRPAFQVLCGGGTSTLARSAPVLAACWPAADLLGLADAVVRVFHREGERRNKHKARLKWVIERLGFPAFRELVLSEWAAVQREGAPALPFDPADPPAEPSIDPAGGPALDVAIGPAPGIGRRPALSTEAFLRWRRGNVVPQIQEGRSAAFVTLALGDLRAAQLLRLAALCETFSDGTVRTTVDQNLVLRHVPTAALPLLYQALDEIGLGQAGAGALSDVVSCPGADTCNIAVTASRGLGALLREHLRAQQGLTEEPGLSGARVHVSGCPNGCGQHHIAAIGFQGGLRKIGGRPLPVYHLTVGGGLSLSGSDGPDGARFGRLIGKVPARRGPQVLDRLLALWRRERTGPEEPLAACLARLPVPRLKEEIADLLQIDEASAAAEDYIDLGQDAPFAVSEAEAECAA